MKSLTAAKLITVLGGEVSPNHLLVMFGHLIISICQLIHYHYMLQTSKCTPLKLQVVELLEHLVETGFTDA